MPSISQHFPLSARRRRRDGDGGRGTAECVSPPSAAGRRAGAGSPADARARSPSASTCTGLRAAPRRALLREEVARGARAAERALAALHGLDRDGAVRRAISTPNGPLGSRPRYIGTAAVELAVLRAELSGHLQG